MCALAGAGLLAVVLSPDASDAREHAAGGVFAAPASASTATVVLVDRGTAQLRALECTSGRETASFPLSPGAAPEVVALAPGGDAAFVAAQSRQLLRLSVPGLELQARTTLAFEANALAASGGADATVLVAGPAGDIVLSAHDAASLATVYEFRADDEDHANPTSIVDRPQRSRFVVAFSDLDEVWEIDYGRDAEPVLKGLVHDYRMREWVELPGRYTPRAFEVPSATRTLVGGTVAHEVLRVDSDGFIGVLDLNVRREIERPAIDPVPAAQRIAAWRGERSRGWVLADEEASALRVLDAGSWKLAEPLPVDGEVLAIAALDDGGVLAALAAADAISLVRVDVGLRRTHEVARGASRGAGPYRFVPGTNGCFALVDAQDRWISGALAALKPGMPAAARGRGS